MRKGLSVIMTKSEIRKEILVKREALISADRREKSERIAQQLFELTEYKEAGSIFAFYSFGSEVDTVGIIEGALKAGKAVALPRCVDDKNMVFHYVEKLSELKPGFKGIMEPGEELPMALSEPDIIIVPGVAFDGEMNRIGYGRGYYDRFFKGLPLYVPRIALAFELQIVPEIPYETLDATMDMIITEEKVIKRTIE